MGMQNYSDRLLKRQIKNGEKKLREVPKRPDADEIQDYVSRLKKEQAKRQGRYHVSS